MTNFETILNTVQTVLAIGVMIFSAVSMFVYTKQKVKAEGRGDKRGNNVSVFLHYSMWILAVLFVIHIIMRFL